MEDVDRPYYLTISSLDDLSGFLRAYERLGLDLQQHYITGFSLHFTDNSTVPITYLGKKLMTVIIPISEEMAKQQLSVVTLDRNGQLEAVPCDRVRMEEQPYIRFTLDYVSDVALIGSDQEYKGDEMLLEGTVNLRQMSAAPGQDPYEMIPQDAEQTEMITTTEVPLSMEPHVWAMILAVLVVVAVLLTVKKVIRKK